MDLPLGVGALTFSRAAMLTLPGALLLMMVSGCRSEPAPQSGAVTLPMSSGAQASDWFVDRAADTGLRFSYFNGMAGDFYFPEMLPGGVALFDYDNDGDLDVFFVQGRMIPDSKPIDQATIPPASLPLKGRL